MGDPLYLQLFIYLFLLTTLKMNRCQQVYHVKKRVCRCCYLNLSRPRIFIWPTIWIHMRHFWIDLELNYKQCEKKSKKQTLQFKSFTYCIYKDTGPKLMSALELGLEILATLTNRQVALLYRYTSFQTCQTKNDF